MKCPKCGYLGYDNGDRCKNCGYGFSLINRDEAALPLRDPNLARGARYRKTPDAGSGDGIERRLSAAPEGTPIDLPLFSEGTLPPPRPPLAVRRSTPTPSRSRMRPSATPRPVELTLNLEAAPTASSRPRPAAVEAPVSAPVVAIEAQPALSSRRASAAALDVALMAGVDLVVLWFTLRLCGLNPSEFGVLPVIPLLSCFVVLNAGYVIMFTGTLGQTLGKMAAGIEVVPMNRGDMDLRRASVRALAMVVSVLPAGLGFLPAALGSARPLHDWLAGTRVVQVRA